MSHTPGPWSWRVGDWDQLTGLHEADAAGLPIGEPLLEIGIQTNCDGHLRTFLEVRDADAALIEAAPKLLAACETLVTALTEAADCLGDAGGYTEEMDAAIEEGTAAVAAARGETP